MRPTPNEPYKSWIRSLPCLIVGCRVKPEAHHVEHNGMAYKGRDESCVPLCTRHHQELHGHGRQRFERERGIELAWWVKHLNQLWRARNQRAA